MTKCSFDPTADIYKDAPIGMFHCPEGVEDMVVDAQKLYELSYNVEAL